MKKGTFFISTQKSFCLHVVIVSFIFSWMGIGLSPLRAQGVQGKNIPLQLKPFLPFFTKFDPQDCRLELHRQKEIDSDYSVWILRVEALTRDADWRSYPKGKFESPMETEMFGVFLVKTSELQPFLCVDVFPTGRLGDYQVSILDASRDSLILDGAGICYGDQPIRKKYFYNLNERKVRKRIDFQGISISAMVEFEGDLYCLSSRDEETSLLTRLKPDAVDPLAGYRIIDRWSDKDSRQPVTASFPQFRQMSVEGESLVLRTYSPNTSSQKYSYTHGRWTVQEDDGWEVSRTLFPSGEKCRPGVSSFIDDRQSLLSIKRSNGTVRRLLVCDDYRINKSSEQDNIPGILELLREDCRFYPLPPLTQALFHKYRPRWQLSPGESLDHQRDPHTLEQNIGPFQLSGDRLWFGISFYDGEGYSGVGGLGSFDSKTNVFRIRRYPELVDWSTSALLVEGEEIWLGLVQKSEGRSGMGGLLRIIPEKGLRVKFNVPAIIGQIVRFNGMLYLGTSEGIYLFQNGKFRQIRFDLDINSQYFLRLDGSVSTDSR